MVLRNVYFRWRNDIIIQKLLFVFEKKNSASLHMIWYDLHSIWFAPFFASCDSYLPLILFIIPHELFKWMEKVKNIIY